MGVGGQEGEEGKRQDRGQCWPRSQASATVRQVAAGGDHQLPRPWARQVTEGTALDKATV